MMKEFHFSRGNLKLNKDILIWNLPAIKTCPASSPECRKFCYALKAQRSYPNCLPSRERNLEFSKRKDFVEQIVSYLKKRKETTIRWHESGDIYNSKYLESLKEIARRLPNKIFYAYTKSYYLRDFWKNIPDNLILIQSVESRFPQLIKWEENTARVIKDESEVKPNEYLCTYGSENELKCGLECKYCMQKGRGKIHVCFIQH